MARRVVYITHYSELFGANRSMLGLILELKRTGVVEPFVILAQDGPLAEELKTQGIRTKVIPFVSWMRKHVSMGGPHHRIMQRWRQWKISRANDRHNAHVLRELEATCREWKIDLVHINSSVIGIGGPLSRALKVPLVWHIREIPFKHYEFKVDGGTGRYRNELRKAQAIIPVSDAVRDDLRSIIGPTSNVHVVRNGPVSEVLLQTLREKANKRWEGITEFRFLQLALFHPSKGQLEAVEAFARVHRKNPATRLVLAGIGRQEAVIQRVKELGLEASVDLPGFVEDPYTELDRAHCVLQCSKYEALSRAILEAMASGIPVIGHASGSTPELIKPGISGELYTTVDQLAQHMEERSSDVAGCKAMGRVAQDMVAEQYTIEAMANGVSNVYRMVHGKG